MLAAQRGYQGAFTLFRDLFVKVIRNVDPSTPGLNSPGSWTVRKEMDGTTSVVTLGQRIVPEITKEYKRRSKISHPKALTLNGTEGYVEFEKQPEGKYYALQGTLQWTGHTSMSNMPVAGFRVLASDQEWTDIYYDPGNETLVVDRSNSSLVPSCKSSFFLLAYLQLPALQLEDLTKFNHQTGRTLSTASFVCGLSSRGLHPRDRGLI